MDRTYWIKQIEGRGGTVRTSVSKRTDLVIVGEEPGRNKLEAAHKYGVPTLFFPVAIALGLFEEREAPKLVQIEETFIASLITSMATLAEDFLVLAESGDSTFKDAYEHARASLECVLTSAYGPSKGTIGCGHDAD